MYSVRGIFNYILHMILKYDNSFPDFIYVGRNTEVSIEMSDNVTITENKYY